jgi:hypothetical protein
MSPGPDFYSDFYCAVWHGLRDFGTHGHEVASRPSQRGSTEVPRCHVVAASRSAVARPSGSRGIESPPQRLVPVGRPGINGLRVCQTSPFGSIRRGR